MLESWIPITIAAAFLQNLRSVLQKSLNGQVSMAGAAYARFFYAWPFSIVYLGLLHQVGGYTVPHVNGEFLLYVTMGGVAQILFTVVLLWMFTFRSFAVGTTFSKLEVIYIAGFGALLMGDYVGPIIVLAIFIGSAGTIILSLTETKISFAGLIRGMKEKATLVGLICAGLLGASVVCFRAASLSLNDPSFLMAAGFTLMVALIFQTVFMGVWFLFFRPHEFKPLLIEWKQASVVGIVGMVGSVCWFTAFTLQNAAYVRALGQVELIFTFLAGLLIFREKMKLSELLAMALIVISILMILLAA